MLMWILNWRDLLTFGLASFLATVAAGLAWGYGSTEHGLIASAAALIFWTIYVRARIWPRARLWRSIVATTRHGLEVVLDGFTLPLDLVVEEVENATEQAILSWIEAGMRDARMHVDGLVLVLKPMPFDMHGWDGKLRGAYLRGSGTILVSWRGPELGGMIRSALGHELGHVILRLSGKPYDEATLRKYAIERGTPY